MSSEGQFIYNLFRRQLAVFLPSFDPEEQIQADLIVQRSFRLLDLHLDPAAVSVLVPLAPPGLNFTEFWVSDVRVSWESLLQLHEKPIVLDIESVRATASEQPAGSEEGVEELTARWLDINGGNDKEVPFEGKYPLLDGATLRIRHVELEIISPVRYGNLSVRLEGVEIKAVDGEARQRDLHKLCRDGHDDGADVVSFSRLHECDEASVRYAGDPAAEPWAAPGAPLAGERADRRFMLDPTPVAALLTHQSNASDMRQVQSARWTLAFPGPTRVLTLPPLLGPAPAPAPADPRLYPFPAPPTEWHVQFAEGSPPHGAGHALLPIRSPQIPLAAQIAMSAVALALVGSVVAWSMGTGSWPRQWPRRAWWGVPLAARWGTAAAAVVAWVRLALRAA